MTLNVCGLQFRTICPDFISYINSFDKLGIQETKSVRIDDIRLHDYILDFKHRKELSKRQSGGIALAYRKCLNHFIKPIASPSKLVNGSASKNRLQKRTIYYAALCIYHRKRPIIRSAILTRKTENEMYMYTDRYTHVLLLGDFNSRTKSLPNYIHIDPYICSKFHSEELGLEYQNELSYFDNSNSSVCRSKEVTQIQTRTIMDTK